MSDLIIRTAARAKVARSSFAQQVVSYGRKAFERFQREQTGQDLVEYGGIIVLVGVIIGALFALDIPGHITRDVGHAVTSIFSGSSSSSKT